MTKTALLLANPTAKRGEQSVRDAVDKLASRYEQLGYRVISQYTQRNGPRERQIVAEHADAAEVIIAIGGDGTVRETVLGMSDMQRARSLIGFIPMGNANVLAREVGIPCNDPNLAIEQTLSGVPRRMDVGAINGIPTFLLMFDAGYFAQVVHTVAALRSHPATNWLYALGGDFLYGSIGIIKLLKPHRPGFTVTAGDQAPFATNSLAIANASIYAKAGSFCPNADPSDGMLEFNAARRGKTMRYSLAAMIGKPNPILSEIGSATRFVLKATERKFVCQVDGDPLPDGPFQELCIEVRPSYYALITPKRS